MNPTKPSASYEVQIVTRDGASLSLDCAGDETLLAAATRAELRVPAVCREGTCGSCRGRCRSGDYEVATHSESALSAEDAADGAILLCRTHARGALVVELDSDLAMLQAPPPAFGTCRVASVRDLGGEIRQLDLTVDLDEGGDLAAMFEPGQFMELQVPQTDSWRAYSLANAPNWSGEFSFLVRLQPDGLFSTWLKNVAAPGDAIRVRGPSGHLALNSQTLRRHVLVAGGTGLAPFLSMLRNMTELGESRPITLYFGVTKLEDLFALDQLEVVKQLLPELQVIVCVWDASDGWGGFCGNVVDAFERALATSDPTVGVPDWEVYVCGPPAVVDGITHAARRAGIPLSRVHSERFV